MKKCSKCGEELPTDMFHKRKKSKDGLNYLCKKCVKEYQYNHLEQIYNTQKSYRENNPQKVKVKWEKWCLKNKKHRKEYNKEYRSQLIAKNPLYDRKIYEKNKPSITLRVKKYRSSDHGKMVRKIIQQRRISLGSVLKNTLTLIQWEKCLETFNWNCCYCGEKTELTLDHFIPLSKKGELSVNNALPACKSCNSSKSNKEALKWFKSQPFYSLQRESKILDYLGYSQGVQQLSLM